MTVLQLTTLLDLLLWESPLYLCWGSMIPSMASFQGTFLKVNHITDTLSRTPMSVVIHA